MPHRRDRRDEAVTSPDSAISSAPDEEGVGEQRVVGAPDVGGDEHGSRHAISTSSANTRATRDAWRTPIQYTPAASTRPQRRGLAVVERERDRHRREDHGEREECARQEREAGIVRLRKPREEQRVDGRDSASALHAAPYRESRTSAACSAKPTSGTPNTSSASTGSRDRERPAPRVQDRDRHVEDEEEREKRLHRREVLGHVVLGSPRRARART